MKEKKAKEIKLKNQGSENITMEAEIAGAMNAIKDDKIKNGIIPTTSHIVIDNFAGKKLKRVKSVIFKGIQYFLKKGTEWNDIDAFYRRNIRFSSKDFE